MKTSHTDIIPQLISSWIVAIVKRAYENCTGDDQILARVNAHEVRALSVSWASFNQVPKHEVMQAAFWKDDTTFTYFFLRSMAEQSDDLYSLGPIVASQTVIAGKQDTSAHHTVKVTPNSNSSSHSK